MLAKSKKEPNPIDKHVGGRIRERRITLDMSQGKLGDALGLTFQQVQKYEKGVNRVGSSRLAQIATVLQVTSIDWFYEGAPGMPVGGASHTPAADELGRALQRVTTTRQGQAMIFAIDKLSESTRNALAALIVSMGNDAS